MCVDTEACEGLQAGFARLSGHMHGLCSERTRVGGSQAFPFAYEEWTYINTARGLTVRVDDSLRVPSLPASNGRACSMLPAWASYGSASLEGTTPNSLVVQQCYLGPAASALVRAAVSLLLRRTCTCQRPGVTFGVTIDALELSATGAATRRHLGR